MTTTKSLTYNKALNPPSTPVAMDSTLALNPCYPLATPLVTDPILALNRSHPPAPQWCCLLHLHLMHLRQILPLDLLPENNYVIDNNAKDVRLLFSLSWLIQLWLNWLIIIQIWRRSFHCCRHFQKTVFDGSDPPLTDHSYESASQRRFRP